MHCHSNLFVVHCLSFFLEFFAKHSRQIEVFSLPPYSPDFNATERLWHYTRKESTHNRYFDRPAALCQSLFATFADMQRHPEKICGLLVPFFKKHTFRVIYTRTIEPPEPYPVPSPPSEPNLPPPLTLDFRLQTLDFRPLVLPSAPVLPSAFDEGGSDEGGSTINLSRAFATWESQPKSNPLSPLPRRNREVAVVGQDVGMEIEYAHHRHAARSWRTKPAASACTSSSDRP